MFKSTSGQTETLEEWLTAPDLEVKQFNKMNNYKMYDKREGITL